MVMMSPLCSVRLTRLTTGRSSNCTVTPSRFTSSSDMVCRSLAAGAKTGDFQGDVVGPEALGPGGRFHRLGDLWRVQFQHVAALPADQKGAAMMFTSMGAADEGCEGRYAVHHAIMTLYSQGTSKSVVRWLRDRVLRLL